MFRNNIAFKGICAIILFITMGISQVSLEIGYPEFGIDTCSDSDFLDQTTCKDAGETWTAFTLDVFMTNTAGCTYCNGGTGGTNEAVCTDGGGVWTFDSNIDAATCVGECSDGTSATESLCDDVGTCSDVSGTCSDAEYMTEVDCETEAQTWTLTYLDQTTCEDAEAIWTPYVWTDPMINGGAYFNGEVGGFQFYLGGDADVAGISGGTSADYLDIVDFTPSSGKVIGFSFGGGRIPEGAGLLLTIHFSTTGELSCFAPQNCTFDPDSNNPAPSCSNVISDGSGGSVEAEWGVCYCLLDTDGDGFCDSVDNCSDTENPDQLDTDGDSANCSGAMAAGELIDPQPTTQIDCVKDGGTWTIVDGDISINGGGDACDACPYDANDDADEDGLCGCTLSSSECNSLGEAYDNCPNGATDTGTGADDQTDTDEDGDGDACDDCINDNLNDVDGDGVCYCTLDDCSVVTGLIDNCPSDPNGFGDAETDDDQLDTDSDGWGDACDNCKDDLNDQSDEDGDGVGNTCDNCVYNENIDQDNEDGDGFGDICDLCPNVATDSTADADFDLVGDDCDLCPGTVLGVIVDTDFASASFGCSEDQCAVDTDADGVCEPVDICAGFDDTADDDSDTVPDGCDICAGFDDTADADSDAVPDGCDICAGFDDTADADSDTVPDGCDMCADSDDTADADSDTVPDGCDICAGFDDTADADSDTVPDGCDLCIETTIDDIAYTSGDSLGCSESQWLSVSQISTYMPDEFAISQNFPNPFNPVTSITFDVTEMDEIMLIVYDLTGKEVVTLVSGIYSPGRYQVEWNAINNAGDGIVSGMYIYRYISSEKAITRKMLYLK